MKKVLLLACLAAALALPAAAGPPAIGDLAIYGDDPVIACDAFDQVKAIATADDKLGAYQGFNNVKNADGYPACELGHTVGPVLAVVPLPAFDSDGAHFVAWGLQLGGKQAGFSFWVLYVEPGSATPARTKSGKVPGGGTAA